MTTLEIPHPVLRHGGKDYKPSTVFNASIAGMKHLPRDGKIALALRYELNDPDLLEMIRTGQAQYLTRTDCTATHKREAHAISGDSHPIELDDSRYSGKVDVRPFIITTQPLENFRSENWNPWLKSILPTGVNLPAGTILAIAQAKSFQTELTPEYQSCIELVGTPDVPEGQWRIRTDGDLIVIRVNTQDKPKIDRMRQDDATQSGLWPSIYLNAIETAIRRCPDALTEGKRWARAIGKKLEEQEFDTSPDALEENCQEYAQTIMGNPLGRILEEEEPQQ